MVIERSDKSTECTANCPSQIYCQPIKGKRAGPVFRSAVYGNCGIICGAKSFIYQTEYKGEQTNQCITFHQSQKNKQAAASNQGDQLNSVKSDFICEFAPNVATANRTSTKHTYNNPGLKKRKSNSCKINCHEWQHHGTATIYQHHYR